MAHEHHHHSHASDIAPAEAERIKRFVAAEQISAHAEQILGELAYYSQQVHSRIGLWSMGELDRFVSDYLPGHVGSPELTQAAPEVIAAFARWLKASGEVPSCDVGAIEKRMRKMKAK